MILFPAHSLELLLKAKPGSQCPQNEIVAHSAIDGADLDKRTQAVTTGHRSRLAYRPVVPFEHQETSDRRPIAACRVTMV